MARPPFDPNRIRVPLEREHAAAVHRGRGRTPAAASPGTPAANLLTVTGLTALVRRALEGALPPTVHVIGQISNFKRHGSGHLYFTLKDDASELSCVMWRSAAARVKFNPHDGLEVVATGSVDVYDRAGRYQLYVQRMEPRGVGALELAFRQLCEKLAREGLFDAARKRPLPAFPQRIVVVTSPTGAAVRDILRTLGRRFPGIDVLICPVRVQGEGAAQEVAAAIRLANQAAERLGGVDLLIVGRGGGSLEDLWAFNEEAVARAIFASTIPVISAVGHEVDTTVADLVADVRAATPTAAAELAVPVLQDVLDRFDGQRQAIRRLMRRRLELAEARLQSVCQRRAFRHPLAGVQARAQRADEAAARMLRGLVRRLHAVRARIDRAQSAVARIAPHAYWRSASLRLAGLDRRLLWTVSRRFEREASALSAQERRLERASPARATERASDRLERSARVLHLGLRGQVRRLSARLDAADALLQALSYKRVLGRGFSITRLKKSRAVVRATDQLHDRERVVTELADGEFESEVVNLRQLELFE